MTDFQPKKILVTGGAGFIGCNYVRYMLEADENVQIINLDALTYAGSLENLKDLPSESRHTFVQGDICDRELVDKLMREHEIDTVVHFAAESIPQEIIGRAKKAGARMSVVFTIFQPMKYMVH